MNLGSRVAVISDVHGERRMLHAMLASCRQARVESIVLLGDLFDRIDQASGCADCLSGWNVTGVIGNHEREAIEHGHSISTVDSEIDRLLGNLSECLQIDDALFVHDGFRWKSEPDGGDDAICENRPHVTFAGHTHFRQALDEHGPLDLSLGRISLRSGRRYLVNPGAAVDGEFAIWDRSTAEIMFERI